MNFKLSKYIIILDDTDDSKYLYNMMSDAIVKIDAQTHLLLTGKNAIREEDIPEQVLGQLLQMGFLLGDQFNELDYLNFKHNSAKYDKTSAAYIVYPTLGCNFDCPYCFENSKGETIDPQGMVHFKNYILNKCRDLKNLSVRWSGGEPLLVWDKIKELGHDFKKNCTDMGVQYYSSIATNGYLLTEEIAKEFADINIAGAQITLEGPPEIHDKKRFTRDGKGTFEQVMTGIEIAARYVDTIIRVNIDRQNVDYFPQLLEILKEKNLPKERIRLFCKPVRKFHDNKVISPDMYSDKEFYDVELDLINKSISYGFPYSLHPSSRKAIRCPYYHVNSFILGPDLSVYKCALFVGEKEQAIGNIIEGGILNLTDFAAYLKSVSYSPFDIEECKNCRVLPMCFGKCPIIWEENNRREDAGCVPEKYTVDEKIKYALRSEAQMKQWESIQ